MLKVKESAMATQVIEKRKRLVAIPPEGQVLHRLKSGPRQDLVTIAAHIVEAAPQGATVGEILSGIPLPGVLGGGLLGKESSSSVVPL